jgi:hypothetical protein
MFCTKCGASNEDSKQFCTNCGAPLNGPQPGRRFQPQPPACAAHVIPSGIKERSIGIAILLSFVTCGYYLFYWMYCITEDTNKLSGKPNETSGGMVILFALLTCGIYSLYWMYKRGEMIDNYKVRMGQPSGSLAILYLVLSIFGLGLISYCLMQNELNNISKELG